MRETYHLEWASKDLGQETRVAVGHISPGGGVNIAAGTCAAQGDSYLYVFRFDGKHYHQLARISLGKDDTRCIKVCDIDRDGRDEIILGTNRAIIIFKMRGKELIKISEIVAEGEIISIAALDIDRDGKVEIIASVKGKAKVLICRYDGRLVLVKSEMFKGTVYCLSAGDTDGDGWPELVVKVQSSKGCIIYVCSFKDNRLTEKWSRSFHDADRNVILVADIDKDGKCEIIFDCERRKVKVLRHRGRDYDTFWESASLEQDPRDLSVFDIDNDGQCELIIACLSTVYIFGWNQGRIIPEWTQTIPNGVICCETAELIKNGFGEIVLGTFYGYIYVIEARRDKKRGKLWVGKVQAIVQDVVTIPDGKPDAERGVEAKATFSIGKVKVIPDKVIVDGDVNAKILYVAALPSQPVHFFQASFSFLEFIHLHGAEPGMEALVFFNVEHINVDVVSPRRIKVTILFEMLVKLIPFFDDDHYHHGGKKHYYDDDDYYGGKKHYDDFDHHHGGKKHYDYY